MLEWDDGDHWRREADYQPPDSARKRKLDSNQKLEGELEAEDAGGDVDTPALLTPDQAKASGLNAVGKKARRNARSTSRSRSSYPEQG